MDIILKTAGKRIFVLKYKGCVFKLPTVVRKEYYLVVTDLEGLL